MSEYRQTANRALTQVSNDWKVKFSEKQEKTLATKMADYARENGKALTAAMIVGFIYGKYENKSNKGALKHAAIGFTGEAVVLKVIDWIDKKMK